MTTPATALAQGIYDIIVGKAAKMPSQSRGLDGICALRDGSGNACFLGHVLSDDEARPNGVLINGTPDSLKNNGQLPKRYNDHIDLLSSLQFVHDMGHYWMDLGKGPPDKPIMRRAFVDIAERFGLNTRVLDEHFPTA